MVFNCVCVACIAACNLISLYDVLVEFASLVLTRMCASVEGFGGPGVEK